MPWVLDCGMIIASIIGLHFLHLMPARSWTMTGTGYDNWLNAETKIQTFMNDTQLAFQRSLQVDASPHKLKIIFMTTHTVCEERYEGAYQKIVQNVRMSKMNASASCAEWLMTEHQVSPTQAYSRCADGFFDREGAMKLNERYLEPLVICWFASVCVLTCL